MMLGISEAVVRGSKLEERRILRVHAMHVRFWFFGSA